MRFNIEGWIPTELEQSLMDGSFETETVGCKDAPEIDDDLLDILISIPWKKELLPT